MLKFAIMAARRKVSEKDEAESGNKDMKPDRSNYFLTVVALFLLTVMRISAATNIFVASWVDYFGDPILNGSITVMAADGRGNVYVGGAVDRAGGISVTNLAEWNGSSWQALGSGVNGQVNALACDSLGNVYVSGDFTSAGQVSANGIAKWDGHSWSALGAGISVGILSLACDSLGNLYVGGSFELAGAVHATNIAKWNGSTWSPLGSGVDSYVTVLSCDKSNYLYAAGGFLTAGGVRATNIARWDGSSWSSLGGGLLGAGVAIALDNAGNLYTGGPIDYSGPSPVNTIAQWNGSAWSTLKYGLKSGLSSLECDGSGNLFAAGAFTNAGGASANRIAKWNGTSWAALGSGMNNSVSALAFDISGNLYAGGLFTTAGPIVSGSVAKWKNGAWSALGQGVDAKINAFAFDSSNNLYAGGNFIHAGGVVANRIAKFDGVSWYALGSGVNSNRQDNAFWVQTMAFDKLGNLFVGGSFNLAGGVPATNIAKWDGSAWSALGQGLHAGVTAMAVDSSGNIYAGADAVFRWDGNSWQTVGTIGGSIRALVFAPDGTLYAGGDFSTPDPNGPFELAKWDGSEWGFVGTGLLDEPDGGIYALAFDRLGNLYVGGTFSSAENGAVRATNVVEWVGSSWLPVGSGFGGVGTDVNSLTFDPSGNLYAAGPFLQVGGVNAESAIWDGISWKIFVPYGGAIVWDSEGNLYMNGSNPPGASPTELIAKAILNGPPPNYLSLDIAGDSVSFLGTPGRNYALDITTNLNPPTSWTAVATNIASTNNAVSAGSLTFTNLGVAAPEYFRVRFVQ